MATFVGVVPPRHLASTVWRNEFYRAADSNGCVLWTCVLRAGMWHVDARQERFVTASAWIVVPVILSNVHVRHVGPYESLLVFSSQTVVSCRACQYGIDRAEAVRQP